MGGGVCGGRREECVGEEGGVCGGIRGCGAIHTEANLHKCTDHKLMRNDTVYLLFV